MFVLPEEKGEGEEGQVVVGSLEAGETGYHDHGQEELLYVLDHYLKLTDYKPTSEKHLINHTVLSPFEINQLI